MRMRLKDKLLRALALTIGVLALSACGSDGGSSGGAGPGPGPQGVFTCQNAVDKKQQLQAGALDKVSVKSSPYFGKLFSTDLLEVMFSLSPEETWKYSQTELDVPVYKVTLAGGQSLRTPDSSFYSMREELLPQKSTIFTALDEAPGNYRQQWMQASGGGGGGSLAGLYIHKESPSRPKDIIEPVILVRSDTDRWTLVHEVMHHVFNVGRRNDPNYKLNMVLRRDLQKLGQKVNDLQREYNADKTDAKLTELAKTAGESLDVVRELAVRSNLEEVSIEGTLIECAAAGKIQDSNGGNVNSALWYIEYSAKNAIQRYNEIKGSFVSIEKMANEKGFTTAQAEAKNALGKIEQYINEVKNLESTIREKAGATQARHDVFVVEAMARLTSPGRIAHLEYHLNEWKQEYEFFRDALANN